MDGTGLDINVWGSRRVNDLGCQFSTINRWRKTLLVAALLLLASSCSVVDGILHFTALRQHCPILLSAAFFSPVMSKYLWLVMKMRYFSLNMSSKHYKEKVSYLFSSITSILTDSVVIFWIFCSIFLACL